MKKHNFSAGPCILPQSVLQQASDAIARLLRYQFADTGKPDVEAGLDAELGDEVDAALDSIETPADDASDIGVPATVDDL